MRKVVFALLAGMWLVPIPMIAGCDRTVSEDKTVEQKPNGQTVTKEDKVTQDPNTGAVTKTQEKSVNNP